MNCRVPLLRVIRDCKYFIITYRFTLILDSNEARNSRLRPVLTPIPVDRGLIPMIRMLRAYMDLFANMP